MADAVISVLVDQFVSRAFQKIEEEVRLVKSAKKDIGKLKKSLRLIQAFLEDAEKKQLESTSVREWLSNLEDISYGMDDVLDQWNTAILRSEIENESNCDAVQEKPKVCLPLLNSCFSANQKAKEVISRREVAKKIKELTEELDDAMKEGHVLGIAARAVDSSEPRKSAVGPRITTSFVDVTEVQGRQRDKAVLVGNLLSHKSKAIDVIPIVGMGGLGKTTLAQMVYKDDSVIKHFDCRIWVCVSQAFDVIKIAKAILEGLHGEAQSFVELEAVSNAIIHHIGGKKFLLVLDDFWSTDEEKWKQLYRPLSNGATGSRILVTTRNEEVAIMMRVGKNMIYSLKTLSYEQCWSIIRQATFEGEEDEGFARLEEIGKKIAKKCKGLPLSARILGGLMRSKKSVKQWKDILNDPLLESNDVHKTFLLSYYDLKSFEKCCFSYCSVFPEDSRIKRDMLIEMWMSQGYLNDFTRGQDCFDSLAMRSFFQDFEVDKYGGSIQSCKMHDLVRDFAQFLTKERCLILEGDSIGEKIEKLDHKTRHLTLTGNLPSQLPPSKTNKKSMIENKLRTLIVASRWGPKEDYEMDFLNLTSVRTLKPLNSYGNIKNAHNIISACQHLRFLDFSDMYNLEELPDSVCELCNLQTLRLKGCTDLKRLPVGIGKLIKLRYLYVDQCYSLEGFPKGFAKLTSLQKLDVIVIPKNKDNCFYVDDFTKLSALKLRGSLTIRHSTNFINPSDAEKLNLKNMEDLDMLNLDFDDGNEQEAMIPEALKPHSNLKGLSIVNYNGITMSPSWISSLVSLRTLRFYRCQYCEILPPLGKLPSLESLELSFMRTLKKVGLEFLGITETSSDGSDSAENRNAETTFVSFPKLRKLTFLVLPEWKEWEGINDVNIKVMPSLHSLSISNSKSLEALPDFLRTTPLQDLSLYDTDGIRTWYEERGGREWLSTSHIPDINFDGMDVKRNGVWVEEEEKSNTPS